MQGLRVGYCSLMHTHTNETPATAPAWCRAGCECGRQRGSATRAQMRAYALAVAVALVGRAACVHCDAPVSLHNGEVDRVRQGCYAPGNVIMTCTACNNGLGQGFDIDRDAYAADVARVSASVPVPSASVAVKAYKVGADVYATLRGSRYAR